jgi:hypothetical protein
MTFATSQLCAAKAVKSTPAVPEIILVTAVPPPILTAAGTFRLLLASTLMPLVPCGPKLALPVEESNAR